jgi:hypothetical protein
LEKGGRSCTLPEYGEMVRRGVKEQEDLRLELSSEGRYALRALLYLADQTLEDFLTQRAFQHFS